MEGIEGPISIDVYEKDGVKYHLYADWHNSVDGGCDRSIKFSEQDDCYETINNNSKYVSFPVFIHRKLVDAALNNKYIDWYFETCFVLDDEFHEYDRSIEGKDYIDQMIALFSRSLQRSKLNNIYYPYGRIHYVDIRDVYMTGEDNPVSCNPFSGNWISWHIINGLKDYQRYPSPSNKNMIFNMASNAIKALNFIIEHAHIIRDLYTIEYNLHIIQNLKNKARSMGIHFLIYWMERFDNIKYITSMYKEVRVTRVQKQLLKLENKNPEIKAKIFSWLADRWPIAIGASFRSFKKMDKFYSRNI